jgi:hypothetical protein
VFAAAVRLVVSVGEELGQHRYEYLWGHEVFLVLQNIEPSVRHGFHNLPADWCWWSVSTKIN